MLRLALHVDYDDGSSADVIASALDIVNFERKFNKSITVFAEQRMFQLFPICLIC